MIHVLHTQTANPELNPGWTRFAFTRRIDSVAKFQFKDGPLLLFAFFWLRLRRFHVARARKLWKTAVQSLDTAMMALRLPTSTNPPRA